MKHTLLLLTLLIGSLSFAQGQGDVTIYSNTGDKFYVVLNGIRQNDRAETNVKITGLKNQWYNCKIISANNNFEIDKNLGVKFDTLITYQIKEKKGKYKMRFFSETSLGTTTTTANQAVVTYHATDNPVDPITNEATNVSTTGNNTTTTTTSTTTTSNDLGNGTNEHVVNGNGETVNMNINIGENGLNANINVIESGNGKQNGNVTTSSSTSVNTTTTTTSSSNINGETYYEETTTTSNNSINNGTTTYVEETVITTSSNGTTEGNLYQDDDVMFTIEESNCYASDADANTLIQQIENESFSDDQLRIANMAAKNNCFSVVQIKKIATIFAHSDDQLSFAKTAYDKCSDKNNYHQLMEVFTFSDDKEALEKYINSKK